MTLQAWTLLLVFLLSLLLLAWPLSHLLTRLIDGELPRPLLRMERLLLGAGGATDNEMTWRGYTLAILLFNLMGALLLFLLLLLQDHMPLEFQIGVVEVAYQQGGWRLADRLFLIAFDDLAGITGGNLAAVGAAAIHNQLYGRGLPQQQAAGEIRRNMHRQQHLLIIDDPLQRPGIMQATDLAKGAGPTQARNQLYALGRAILIVDGQGTVAHLQGGGKGEEGGLQYHRHDEQHAPLPVIEQGLQLFANKAEQSIEHGVSPECVGS